MLDVSVKSPESRWLLTCLRERFAEKPAKKLFRTEMDELIAGAFDWHQMFKLAGYHVVRPLVYQYFYRKAFDDVPQDAHQELSTFIRHNLISTTLLASNLPKVLSILQKRGVPALPYKGPALASLLYGDAALREFSDLDILIHQADTEPACQALTEAGFTAAPSLNPRIRSAFFLHSTACEFTAPSSVFRVELHWKNSGRSVNSFPEEWFWHNKQKIMLGEVDLETVPLITHLLMLCIHGSKHGWSRMGYLCDIATLLQKYPDLDWQTFWARANTCGAEKMCALAFQLIENLLGVTTPLALNLSAHTHGLQDLVMASLQLMKNESEPGALYALRLQDSLHGKIRFLARMGFTPGIKEYSMIDLPPKLHFLYSGIRAARMTSMLMRNQ
jgi:hypothetical protein